uniref:Carboxylesterase type B domain-containing protein n=1 Tax=Takifugu rubripes TaxID=31033 RepID=H2UXB1_TAKRU
MNPGIWTLFQLVSENDVIVNPNRKLPTLSFWLNKKHFDSQHALLWCLSRKYQKQLCECIDADSTQFHSCSLYPDSRECGGYENPRRQSCALVLETPPDNTYSKTVNLSGPIKSFFERIPFQKMVSYSQRKTHSLFMCVIRFIHCERRCDEDPCCRGFGFIRDNKSMSNHDVLCLSLISFGVQTCSEEDSSSWRTQDCSTSVQTGPEPLGWYQKPVSQDQWQVLSNSMVLVDRSLSTYDVIHISRDIATNPDETRDFCLLGNCSKEESCVAVTLMQVASATRCILYPDTTICGLSSTLLSSNPTSSCRLLIREPASHVYLRTEPSRLVTSISIPGHGTLQGAVTETGLGSVRKSVVQFLGVPYARPPIGSLRFEAAQLADWTGTWDATKPRPSCIQPGDSETAASSEDCLYLNIFTPRGHVPVLVFFTNLGAYQSSQMLDGSILAAVGNIVVVTASYRVAAFGFLSTGFSGLHGNYGLSDQEAVLHWVNAHISLVGGDNERVTVGAEQRGADITSLHLLSSSPRFQRMLLMGGSVFSPSLLQTPPSSRREALQLATELGCFDNLNDMEMAACLRAIPAHELNIAQTKLLAVSGPFQSWSPVHQPTNTSSFQRVDLLIGTSQHDSLITRARRLKDLGDLLGHADGKTAFYEALSRSLGSVTGSEQLKEVEVWFYSLDHSPTASGYNLFSRALDNATRDLFIICPSLRMVSHWAKHKASAFLYHQAETSVPLDVQLMFGSPYHPINIQRFTRSDRRLSLATMTYFSTFVRTGNPNPSHLWAESVLPQWPQVVSSDTPLTYLELSPTLKHNEGLSQRSCSFWNHLASRLTSTSSESHQSSRHVIRIKLQLRTMTSPHECVWLVGVLSPRFLLFFPRCVRGDCSAGSDS